jgi:hypothetical protein
MIHMNMNNDINYENIYPNELLFVRLRNWNIKQGEGYLPKSYKLNICSLKG